MYAFTLFSVTGNGFQEEAYSDADTQLEMEFEEHFTDLIDWLDENLKERYELADEYFHVDHYTVECVKIIQFVNEADALAFKMMWPEYKCYA